MATQGRAAAGRRAMIRAFHLAEGGLRQAEPDAARGAVWIDLYQPDEGERARIAALIGLPIPSRAEQEEIEHSSRLYMADGVPVMTALLPAGFDGSRATLEPVSFILTERHLVTLRHHDPQPFESYPGRAAQASLACHSAETVLLGLIEAVVDRLADITEHAGREIDTLSRASFAPGEARAAGQAAGTAVGIGVASETGGSRGKAPGKPRRTDHRAALRAIGLADGLVMQLRESLLTMERLLGFLMPALEHRHAARELRGMVKSTVRDVRTIAEQAGFLQQKTALLLDATLGLINIEQAEIIKIFSVVAVIFLPPTLIASVYGMNFAAMPELDWAWGYPVALGLMACSVLAALAIFRRKGWF